MKDRQSGFGVVEVIILVIILGLVGFGGWYVWQAQQKKDQGNTTTSQTKSSDPYEGWIIYSDTVGKFTIKYPGNWTFKTEASNQGEGYPTNSSTTTSPSGKKLVLDVNYGGKGGACFPAETDKPFRKGNVCPSIEYTSAEKLPVTTFAYSSTGSDRTLVKSDIYLVGIHYEQSDGVARYGYGLISSPSPIKVKDPVMGAVVAIAFFTPRTSTGAALPEIDAYAIDDDPAFMDSSDGQNIKKILQTFRM